MKARYQGGSIGRFLSKDPLEGDLANPQSLNVYSYVMNNPLVYIDPFGLRAMTEHETRVTNKIQALSYAANDAGAYEQGNIYHRTYNIYTTTISELPEDGDPGNFTIMNDALFKWYDQQVAYESGNLVSSWDQSMAVESDYYSDSQAGDWKCNFFVAETLYDALGVERDIHGFFGKNPPLARDWVNNSVEGFYPQNSPIQGDVIAFDYEGGVDHVGIYFGEGLYISVTNSGNYFGQPQNGIKIKPIPVSSGTPVNYNRLFITNFTIK